MGIEFLNFRDLKKTKIGTYNEYNFVFVSYTYYSAVFLSQNTYE